MLTKKVTTVGCWFHNAYILNSPNPFHIHLATIRTLRKQSVVPHVASGAVSDRDDTVTVEHDGKKSNYGNSIDVSSEENSAEQTGKTEKVPLEFKLYNTVLNAERHEERYQKRVNFAILRQTIKNIEYTENINRPSELSVAARYLLDASVSHEKLSSDDEFSVSDTEMKNTIQLPPQYPYAIYQKSDYPTARTSQPESVVANEHNSGRRCNTESKLTKQTEDRLEGLAASLQRMGEKDERLQKVLNDEDDRFEEELFHMSRYGTPDPKVPPSTIECSGCGAFLHCQSTGLPGYIPSELFVGASKGQLRSIVCQRCHFLKEHNVALNVTVGPNEYPKLLQRIRKEVALVVLVVDLLDFPCSIWPDLVDIIGHNRPICVVGNKVDLLPRDDKGYLNRVRSSLEHALKKANLDTGKNIKHVTLVSAKSGQGIEELITAIQSKWGTKGDIYLVGCTNVGKSTLFNALLQSDLCKSQAVDIIQRATTSVWPGTTLNLLKFPLLRPTPYRLYLRTMRLREQQRQLAEERKARRDMLRETKDPQYASLISHIGLTFFQPETIFARKIDDGFKVSVKPNPSPISDLGKVFNPNDFDFAGGHWCYDTPGVVHKDQIISLLTLEELNAVLPKEFIHPKTYALQPNLTLFLAGLGRIDYIEGNLTVRLTIFASPSLPVSILPTINADEFYKKYFGTHVLKVPCGSDQRLDEFPPLLGKEVVFTGIEREQSCADIVLSSAGWVAVSIPRDVVAKFKVYTPAGRGCHFRQPAILPFAVKQRGKRVRSTPRYKNDKLVTNY